MKPKTEVLVQAAAVIPTATAKDKEQKHSRQCYALKPKKKKGLTAYTL